MENKENKIKAVRLSDDELENVSGGYSVVASEFMQTCDICRNYSREFYLYRDKYYCSACKEKAGF